MASDDTPAQDQAGRPLGPRALHTRLRLLEATNLLLRERRARDVSVVEIARRVGTSPATFYQYFKDVSEVILALADQAASEIPPALELIDASWAGAEGLARARQLVEGFVSHWDTYRPVLLARNLAADEGDQRFAQVRQKAMAGIVEGLARKVEKAQQEGTMDPAVHPYVAASAAATILERLSAYHKQLEFFGVTREDLVDGCARLMVHTLSGRWDG